MQLPESLLKFLKNNKDILFVSKEYVNYHKEYKFKHTFCNSIFKSTITNILRRKKKCSICYPTSIAIQKKLSLQTANIKAKFFKLIDELGYIYLKGKVKNNKTPILIKCNKCSFEWKVSYNTLQRGSRCPKCANEKRIENLIKMNNVYTIDSFKELVYDLTGDEYTVLSKKYIHNKSKILMRHNSTNCNYSEYEVRPNDFQQGYRCPICNRLRGASKNEMLIDNVLKLFKIPFEREFSFSDCKNKRILRFDFAIKMKNEQILLIEYNGKQHYILNDQWKDSFKRTLNNDIVKDKYAKNNSNVILTKITYLQNVVLELIKILIRYKIIKRKKAVLKLL
jgi:predicted Zn-ribbon and HTH transcriptional regulator